jgi:hypothetical protein
MIIAHIIGINSYLKTDFVTKMNNINIDVIDLDELTKKLLIKSNYDLKPEEWKEQIYNELNNNYHKKNSNVVIIGLTNFINDNRYKIKLDVDNSNYFFIDIPIDSCTTQIITHNLDIHRQSIINGEFPLKFLNREFIEEQRLQLQEIYEKTHKKIKYDKMIDWIKDYIQKNKVLYVTSLNRYETKLEDVSYAYNEEWLSLSSIAPKSMITRGIIDGKPIIKELKIGGFAELNKPGYVYEVKQNYNEQYKQNGGVNGRINKDPHRTKLTNLNFNRRRYVSNILDELKRIGVIFEIFKYN